MVRLQAVVLPPVVQVVLQAVQAVLQPLVEVPILEVQEDQVEDTLQVEDVLRVGHGEQVEDVVHVAHDVPVEDVHHVVHGVPVEDVHRVVHEEVGVLVHVVAVVVEIRDQN